MGSWATLTVGGQDVFHWKSEVDPTFLFLFTDEELIHRPLDDPDELGDHGPTLMVCSTVGVLADRLDALGVATADLDSCLQHAIGEEIEMLESMAAEPWGWNDVEDRIGQLRGLTFDTWLVRVKAALSTPVPPGEPWDEYTNVESLVKLWEDFDPRWLLRAILAACDPADEVLLDLTDLEIGGYLEAHDFDPQLAAISMFSYAVANGTPAVVITEGTTDVEFLRAAIQIRRPHLVRFIKFFDFGVVPVPGGAAAAINTLKAFAAAGVNNRVIVLLDNDTAARDAARALRNVELPSHYVVAHYPHLDSAENYPSTGPTGDHAGDVNGLAGSIELYLGADVLTDPGTSALRPVVWGARVRALNAYQGEVADKDAIHQAFRAKVAVARENPSTVDSQDWAGLDAILDALMDLLRTCGVPGPAQRSAFIH